MTIKSRKFIFVVGIFLLIGYMLSFSLKKDYPTIPITQIILSYENPIVLFDIIGNLIKISPNYKLNSSLITTKVNTIKASSKEYCLNGNCINIWPAKETVVFTWLVPPNKKYEKWCAIYNGKEICSIYASLCTMLCGENNLPGCIPGNKSDGSYYTCNDVIYGVFLKDTKDLEDTDGDGLKEIKAIITNKIVVYNPNSYSLTDYQVRIDLSLISSYLSSIDYKFKLIDQDGNILPYCFEQSNGECGTTPSNVIWVKVAHLPANSNISIYITPSDKNEAVNGDQIFDFYDDFNDGTWDDKWYTVGEYCNVRVESSGERTYLRFNSDYNEGCTIYSKQNNISSNSIIEEEIAIPSVEYGDIDFSHGITDSSNRIYITICGGYQDAPNMIVYNGNTLAKDNCVHYSDFKLLKFITASGNLEYKYGSVYLTSNYEYYTITGRIFYIISAWSGSVVYIDWIRVRKYADKEPIVFISSPFQKDKIIYTYSNEMVEIVS